MAAKPANGFASGEIDNIGNRFHMNLANHKLAVAITALLLITVIFLLIAAWGDLRIFTEPTGLVETIREMGFFGPALIIGLMCIAIVLNPLPSAPVALAAGAVYGHFLGTVYVVIGAELGAIIAFFIARWAGYDFTRKHFGDSGVLRGISSQNTLTALVFFSRLVPFVSFDLVSYAAGLSPITAWRFAIATLLGLVPVSFALAHFGAEIDGDNKPVVIAVVLVIGLFTLAPLALRLIRSRGKSTEPGPS